MTKKLTNHDLRLLLDSAIREATGREPENGDYVRGLLIGASIVWAHAGLPPDQFRSIGDFLIMEAAAMELKLRDHIDE